MVDIFEHPQPDQRHEPDVKTFEVGARCTCVCGWSASGRNGAQVTRAYRTHMKSTTQREGAQS